MRNKSSSLFRIRLSYQLDDFFLSTQSIEPLIEEALPLSLKKEAEADPTSFASLLNKSIPIIYGKSITSESGFFFFVTCIIPAEYTHGAGRYIADTLARWLIPGKNLGISFSMNFHGFFELSPTTPVFCCQNILRVSSKEEIEKIALHFPEMAKQLKVNILAGYFARYITSLKTSDALNKEIIIQEHLGVMFNQSNTPDLNPYDHAQMLLNPSNAEKKKEEVKKVLSNLVASRIKAFDREIFHEVMSQSTIFHHLFTPLRNPKHLSRAIAYLYLFKKTLLYKVSQEPARRFTSIKVLFETLEGEKPVLAVVGGINFLKEEERFDLKHLMAAIRSRWSQAVCIPDTILFDRREEKIILFYFEIEKTSLSSEEAVQFKKLFAEEILKHVENPLHPIFMPRNDEELLRNLVVLNRQIKQKKDLPQVSIYYDFQSEDSLIFSVICARVFQPQEIPLGAKISSSTIATKFQIDDLRTIGQAKKNIAKESIILHATLNKSPFFRPDSSLDILKARQKLAIDLKELIGEFRDFNGGLIIKQEESFLELRSSFESLSQEEEFFLENYFYAIRPSIFQTVYPSCVLKYLFQMFCELRKQASSEEKSFSWKGVLEKKYVYIAIKANSNKIKEEILSSLFPITSSSHEWISSTVSFQGIEYIGFICEKVGNISIETFENALLKSKNCD